MNPTRRLIQFLLLTFAFTWGLWIPAALIGGELMSLPVAPLYMFGGFGPSLAALVMVFRTMDRETRRDYWRRLLSFRQIRGRWYAVIFLIFPVLFALATLIHVATGGAAPGFTALNQVLASPLSLIPMVILQIFTGPLAEELGWRGYALDRLPRSWNALTGSLVIGLVWWAWHLPLFFIQGTLHASWGVGSTGFWAFLLTVVPLSVLMTWIYNRTGRSILAAVLAHFAFNQTLALVHPFDERMLLIFAALFAGVVVGGLATGGAQALAVQAGSSSLAAVEP